ncbi:5-deoxy-glucuronate isomerase [Anaerovibrio sp.]|uniref:5-deoxy-glucuronate isomerase n=1 Tax=Anaerovibrio sp. TaxID=1872532 RepID=UPI001B704BBA|nr:5-deoxy-glucuronate isomerase [Anaerovibrio sp.]MBP3230898.1 5-deoxy-glucuronate isomerase [Anaerovibrio sp.]MBR2143689.1 5-deoxy-glucuronate isomerase [Anaerovibrio sp.]
MRFGRLGELKHGYNAMTTRESDMLMDIGYQLFDKNEVVEFEDALQETAFVILVGEVEITWDDQTERMHRESLFDQNPYCLHVPCGKKVVIKALTDGAEVLVQKTVNEKDFAPKFYRPEDVQADVFGQGMWNGTAERTVRTIFDYDNAPYSNMVNGEVINSPGRWSGYIPHNHPQPEVYTYKFDHEQGFGACFIGDNAFKITHNSWSELSGGYMHPQVTAPGYAMWYSWMIRHLPDNPWKKTRNDLPEHVWLNDPNAEIWSPKK